MSLTREWLLSLRNEKGATMRSVAEQTDISESFYCQIESGLRRPSPEVAKKIAEVLDFDWVRFYEDESAIAASKRDSA